MRLYAGASGHTLAPMNTTRSLFLVVALCFMGGITVAAQSQGSRCADCHVANQDAAGPSWSSKSVRHLQDWDYSRHSRANVGCEKCHGGNPATFEKNLAHQNMLPPSSPASPVARVNLPKTCGTCHTGPFVSFQKSHHYKLLTGGDDRGPTCSTCHGEVAAQLLSPVGLANQCSQCHGPNKPVTRPGRASEAMLMMTEVREVRHRLSEAQDMIRRVKDRAARARFEEQWKQAEVPIIEAANAGHEFVFDNLKERLDRARQRTDALLDALVSGDR